MIEKYMIYSKQEKPHNMRNQPQSKIKTETQNLQWEEQQNQPCNQQNPTKTTTFDAIKPKSAWS